MLFSCMKESHLYNGSMTGSQWLCIVFYFLTLHTLIEPWSIAVQTCPQPVYCFVCCFHSSTIGLQFWVEQSCTDLWRGAERHHVVSMGPGMSQWTSVLNVDNSMCVFTRMAKNIPFAVCQMSNSCWTWGKSSLIIFCIDVERSVAITSTSTPVSRRSFIPLLNPSGSIAPELVASVH